MSSTVKLVLAAVVIASCLLAYAFDLHILGNVYSLADDQAQIGVYTD
ncbi:hypothetical protein EC844_12344 [Acinetobacter calcoaceticus]|uniref:Uncharacterized protein n=1 Tax=Acinetobacter calcoaceticus TaxID=471 RepID=A0A4R1XKV0_ACICA|nr:hypothetical protein EC844_12344 [Acinetobacter calcoaceticus]